MLDEWLVTYPKKPASAEELLAAQTRLAETTSDKSNSVTQQTLASFRGSFGWTADQLQTRWAWLLAFCLSLIVLAVQIGLGSLSDGSLSEKQSRTGDGLEHDPEVSTAKKRNGLSVVQ